MTPRLQRTYIYYIFDVSQVCDAGTELKIFENFFRTLF